MLVAPGRRRTAVQALAFLDGAGPEPLERPCDLRRRTTPTRLRPWPAHPNAAAVGVTRRMGGMSERDERTRESRRPRVDRADAESRSPCARSAFRRSARLASLPLGFAGRSALGLGRRIGGAPAEQVSEQLQQRAAEQLFKVLGELKGGAMKFGQALSLFEAVLPDDVAAPYRQQLARLQDSAPPMPTSRVHAVLARELGPHWRDSFTSFSAHARRPPPPSARSTGRLGRRAAGRGQGAVPGCRRGPALRPAPDRPDVQGHLPARRRDGRQPLVDELTARVSEELDYTLEAAAQARRRRGSLGDAEFFVPAVLATTKVMVSEWVEGAFAEHRRSSCPRTSATGWGWRTCGSCSPRPARVGLLHADPHPGNFKMMPDGRLGVIDFGLVARLPDGLPPAMGRILRVAESGNAQRDGRAAARGGLHRQRRRRRGPARLPRAVRRAGGGARVPVHPGLDARAVHAGPRLRGEQRRGDEDQPAARVPADPPGLARRPRRAGPAQRPGAPFNDVLEEFLPGYAASRERAAAVSVRRMRPAPAVVEPVGAGGEPWTWSTARDDERTGALSGACTREHARSIEAKLEPNGGDGRPHGQGRKPPASSLRDTVIRLGRRHAAGRGSQVFTVDPKGSLAAVSRIEDASRTDGIENGMVPPANSPHS